MLVGQKIWLIEENRVTYVTNQSAKIHSNNSAMKKLLLKSFFTFLILNSLFLFSFSQAPEIKWAYQYPPNPEQNAAYTPEEILETVDGFIICGHKNIQVGTNPSHSNVFVMKVNKEGDTLWIGDYPVDPEGEFQPNEKAYSIAQTDNGSFYVVGFHSQPADDNYNPPRAQSQLLIMEIMPDGTKSDKYISTHSSLDRIEGKKIYKTSNSTFVITGFTNDYEASFSNDKILFAELSGNNIEPVFLKSIPFQIDGENKSAMGVWATATTENNYLFAGNHINNNFDIYLKRTNYLGNVTNWQQNLGGDGGDFVSDVVEDEGFYYLAGYTPSQTYVVKIDGNGEVKWEKEFGYDNSYSTYSSAIGLAEDGNLIITGFYQSTNIYKTYYIFLAKIDKETGDVIWIEDYETNSSSRDAIVTTNFGYLVAGKAVFSDVPQKQVFLCYLGYDAEYSVWENSNLALGLGLVTTSDNIDVMTANDLTGNLYGVTVTINELLHSEVDKLEIFLEHGDISVKLVDKPQNPATGFINTTFFDGAVVPIAAGSGTFTGIYKPEEPLRAFNGTNPKGDWTLRIVYYSGSGLKSSSEVLNGWTLKLLTDAGSGTGIYSPDDIENFLLYPCYPNPLSTETRIEFKIPKRSHVNLSVYNQSGQIVKKLVNTELYEGEHSAVWNAQEISAGTYFIHLESEGIVSIQKLVVIK